MKTRCVLTGRLLVWAAFPLAGGSQSPVELSPYAGMEGKTGITAGSNAYTCGYKYHENRKATGKIGKNRASFYLMQKAFFRRIFIDRQITGQPGCALLSGSIFPL